MLWLFHLCRLIYHFFRDATSTLSRLFTHCIYLKGVATNTSTVCTFDSFKCRFSKRPFTWLSAFVHWHLVTSASPVPVPIYHSAPDNHPCTTFQGDNLSIQMYAVCIMAKRPWRQKLRVTFSCPWALTRDTASLLLHSYIEFCVLAYVRLLAYLCQEYIVLSVCIDRARVSDCVPEFFFHCVPFEQMWFCTVTSWEHAD